MRVVGVYAAVGWVIMEVSATVLPNLGFPQWMLSSLIVLIILGFPVAMVVAWVYDMTPDGIRATDSINEDAVSSKDAERPRKQQSLPLLLATAAVPTVIFGVLAFVFYFKARSVSDELVMITNTLAEAEVDRSIAVLPLENMSPDPDNAFFADGVQEDILTNLSKIQDMLVISRSSTLRYRTGERNLKQIGKELGVRYIVEGSVRRSGNQVRVTSQLIDTQTDGHLWAENYNRELTDIFSIQSDIAKQIAAQLHAVISPSEQQLIEYRPSDNQEAYDAFVQTKDGIGNQAPEEKRGFLAKAVELDPTFAEAWAQLAIELIYNWNTRSARQDAAMYEQAHRALEQARIHGSELAYFPFAQASFASHEDKDTAASISFLLEALNRDPSFFPAKRSLGSRYIQLGRLEEAQLNYKEALIKDPFSSRYKNALVGALELQGKWDEAKAIIDQVLAENPQDAYWLNKLADTNFRRTGNLENYVEKKSGIPGFLDTAENRFWRALNGRDYSGALKVADSGESLGSNRVFFNPALNSTIRIVPKQLELALIHFEFQDREKGLTAVVEARELLEEVVANDPQTNPVYWAGLAICHAFENDFKRMTEAIENAREVSKTNIWTYLYEGVAEAYISIAQLVMGEEAFAIETLEHASQRESAIQFNRELLRHFIFDRLRGNPRFDSLLLGEVLSPDSIQVDDKSIAVLPLENMSPDPDNAFFADGVQEDILTNLSKVEDFFVISRSSTMRYREGNRDLKQIGKELGVRYLVEGSVRRAGNQVLVTAQLIDTFTDGHLWAENYSRSLDDIFAIQADIAKSIAGELKATISPEVAAKIDRRPTKNQEAYDLFVKVRRTYDEELYFIPAPKKIAMLEEIVALDPTFAEAWAHLAVESNFWWYRGTLRKDQALYDRAHYALEQVRHYGAGLAFLPYAERSFAIRVDGNSEAAFQLSLETLRIDPNFIFGILHHGRLYFYRNQLSEAQLQFDKAYRMDPLSWYGARNVLDLYELRGMWDNAAELIQTHLEKGERLDYWQGRRSLLEYIQSGDRQDFLKGLEAHIQFDDTPINKVMKALCLRDLDTAAMLLNDMKPGPRAFSFMERRLTGGTHINFKNLNLFKALVLFGMGDQEQWLGEADKAKIKLESQMEGNIGHFPDYWAELALAYALTDQKPAMNDAIQNVRYAFTADPRLKYRMQAFTEVLIAMAYVISGDEGQAIETIEIACRMDSPLFLDCELDLWFIFDRLRGNQRFDALLKSK